MTADVLQLPTATIASRQLLARPLAKLALSPFERAAVTTLAGGDKERIVAHVEDRATAFASGDPEVRRRALSRAAAVQESVLTELATYLAVAIRNGDPSSAALDRAVTSATNRYLALIAALRTEFAPTRRVMAVAKGTIAITAEEQP